MWWEIVGCVRSRLAVKSQMQTGCFAFHRALIMVSRVGSASAFIKVAVSSAHPASTSGSAQHTPRSRTTGSSLSAIATKHTTSIDRRLCVVLASSHRQLSMEGAKAMSEVREAVRSHYADVAKQLVVF